MECNRDEAIRAKEIAERKLTGGDYFGAKRFVLKAQNLYPGLEGLSQMLTILDVYIAAENKINGEVDWYGILGVNPLADDETLKKGYRKLALALHPDKNKFIGADGAFKLVSEAWSFLSDKVKRSSYNHRRSVKGFQHKVPTQSGGPSAPFRANDFNTSVNSATSNARTQSNTTRMSRGAAASQPFKKTDTFWTICHHCKTQYEYLRIYLNHNLLCPNCHEPFMASERAPPTGMPKAPYWASRQQQQNSTHHAASNNQFDPGRNAAVAPNTGFRRPAGNDSYNHDSLAGSNVTSLQGVSVSQQANVKLKREREEAFMRRGAGLSTEFPYSNSEYFCDGDVTFKKKKTGDDTMNSYRGNMAYGLGNASGSRSFDTTRTYNFSVNNCRPSGSSELSLFEIRNMLMAKAKTEIQKNLKEWNSATEARAFEKVKEKRKEKEKPKLKKTVNADADNLKNYTDSIEIEKGYQGNKFSSPGIDANGAGKEDIEPVPMDVPDPDFHNFDMDRIERSFGESQVWAAYDDDDGMPRYYAMISKVISLNPFKIRISWLNSRSNSEFGPLEWVGSGFAKTCGDFRVGRYEIYTSLNSFSHKVTWTKGARGVICIYPRKGDVWAVYRNWSPNWNQDTPDEVVHKYDMVEVLGNYDEEHGVSVSPLLKIAGFRAVFHRHADPKEVRRIPKEEMFRFSHQVPNYLITGEEAENAPIGCRELDPAATPLELLQVITEANKVPIVENGVKAEKEMLIDEKTENSIQIKGKELNEPSKVAEKTEVVDNAVKTRESELGD